VLEVFVMDVTQLGGFHADRDDVELEHTFF
jgi:hypothetical protein